MALICHLAFMMPHRALLVHHSAGAAHPRLKRSCRLGSPAEAAVYVNRRRSASGMMSRSSRQVHENIVVAGTTSFCNSFGRDNWDLLLPPFVSARTPSKGHDG